MSTIASQITSLTIFYSTIYSGADQRKYQSSASLAFVWGIHRGPVNCPHKWPVTRKMFPFDDVIMKKVYELVNLGGLKSPLLNKQHIFQCMDKIFCMELQRAPRKRSSWGQHGAHLGSVRPRWAPCWPHETCYQSTFEIPRGCTKMDSNTQWTLIGNVYVIRYYGYTVDF